MSDSEGHFRWPDADEAADLLQRHIEQDTEKGEISAPFIDIPETMDPQEGELLSLSEPKSNLTRYLYETQKHLDDLWVLGAPHMTENDLRMIGPLLARDDSYREDAVFHILQQRRDEVQPYMRRFMTVKLKHLVQYGLATQAGRLSPERIQRNSTDKALKMIEPIIEPEEVQDYLLSSHFQRRVLRSIFYILNEPNGSTRRFKERLELRAKNTKLDVEEVLVQTYGFVNSQAESHKKANPMHFESEESMVKLMEQMRLTRLQCLGRTVLAQGLGMVMSKHHQNED